MAKKMTRSKVKKDKTPKEDQIFSRKDAEFRAMCAWIERELFNYNGTDQHLHTKACLRLQGLRKGQNIANNKHDKYGNYSVECVFNTFKANKLIIQNAIKGKDFADEYKKMAYICAIIEVRINEMYLRMKNAELSKQKQESIDTKAQDNDTAEYKRQTDESTNSVFEDIW